MLTRLRWEMSESGGLQHLNKNDSLANKQNKSSQSEYTGTTDAFGLINTDLSMSLHIFCATVTNNSGYGVIPVRRNNRWAFFIIAANNSNYAITVPATQFTIVYLYL